MEYNGYYSSDHKNRDSEGRGGNTFATIVIIVVIILLALMVIGLFAPNLLGISPADTLVNATPTPSMTQQADITPTPEPGATAAPEALVAHRLIKFLQYFLPIDDGVLDEIPPLSILREFIGECTFYDRH